MYKHFSTLLLYSNTEQLSETIECQVRVFNLSTRSDFNSSLEELEKAGILVEDVRLSG